MVAYLELGTMQGLHSHLFSMSPLIMRNDHQELDHVILHLMIYLNQHHE
jgi:hypothetical protein